MAKDLEEPSPLGHRSRRQEGMQPCPTRGLILQSFGHILEVCVCNSYRDLQFPLLVLCSCLLHPDPISSCPQVLLHSCHVDRLWLQGHDDDNHHLLKDSHGHAQSMSMCLYVFFNYRLRSSAHLKDKKMPNSLIELPQQHRGQVEASQWAPSKSHVLQKCSQTKQLLIASERGSNKHPSPAEIRGKLRAIALNLILWLLMLNKSKMAIRVGTPPRSHLLICLIAVSVSLDWNPAQPCAAPANPIPKCWCIE